MALLPWQPLRELDALRHQMDRMFDELMHGDQGFSGLPKLEHISWAPAIELQETEAALIVKAVVPGVAAKDLEVQVSDNAVSIAGEHRQEQQVNRQGYFHSELQYGQFQRIVPLPMAIQTDQVQASFQDGLLTLTLPKAASSQSVTRIDLTTQERARESVVQQRQQEEHRQESMRSRANEAMAAANPSVTESEARERMAKQRQQDEHLRNTMHQRAADRLDAPA